MIEVILVKIFRDIHGNKSSHYRRCKLPMPPFIGMGIVFDHHVDPEIIEHVFINQNGEIVCSMPYDDWLGEAAEFEDGAFDAQREYQLRGWAMLAEGDLGPIRLYKSSPQPSSIEGDTMKEAAERLAEACKAAAKKLAELNEEHCHTGLLIDEALAAYEAITPPHNPQ